MAAEFSPVRTQKASTLAATLAIAILVNLILLLLIAALADFDETQPRPDTRKRPVEFIRIAKKTPEPKPAPPAEEKPAEQPKKPAPKPKQAVKPPPKKAPKKAIKKPAKRTYKVAAPKLDIPLDGSGASFASVAGKDSRLTAPPTKWDVEQKPEPPKEPVTRRLVAVSRVMPTYPWKAKALGIEGWAKIEIIVATDGTVKSVKVVDDHPKNVFGEAAVKAVKQWHFQPAFVEGQAVEQKAVQLMEFKLRN